MDRIRGRRTPRGNGGCRPPCPTNDCGVCSACTAQPMAAPSYSTAPVMAAPAAAPCGGCSSAPVGGDQYYIDGQQQYSAESYSSEQQYSAPVMAEPAVNGDGEGGYVPQSNPQEGVAPAAPATDGGVQRRTPVVDPSAFIINKRSYSNN